jgi:hypothetical protein
VGRSMVIMFFVTSDPVVRFFEDRTTGSKNPGRVAASDASPARTSVQAAVAR